MLIIWLATLQNHNLYSPQYWYRYDKPILYLDVYPWVQTTSHLEIQCLLKAFKAFLDHINVGHILIHS